MPDRENVLHELDHQVADADWCDNEWKDNVPIWMLRGALALLQEQEPVKPIKTPETIRAEYNCGKCTAPVGIMFHDGDWYYKADYCPRCGRKVKWDG